MSTTRAKLGKLPRYVKPTEAGKCPHCHKNVKAVEQHVHDQHKGEKILKKR